MLCASLHSAADRASASLGLTRGRHEPDGKIARRDGAPPAFRAVPTGAPRMRDLLTIDRVSLAFGGIAALAEVSAAVAQGRVTAIIGPNGAGKTSLFNVISGFYRPASGAVTLDGRD